MLAGKKVSVTNLEALPEITTNNYRQILSQTPGLFVSEVANESFASINYRGLGDPHESFNLLMLKDGLPIAADPYGYPANYYQPPVDSVERVEFVRGGASLLYGPQPGGSLNFVTKKPVLNQERRATSKHIVGSKNLYSTYNEISGGDEDAAGMGFFHHRGSDGFRNFNSDYDINNGGARFTLNTAPDTLVHIDLDAYSGRFGEPGGLSNVPGEGLAYIGDNRFASTLTSDQLRIDRYAPTLTVEQKLDGDTSLTSKVFGGYFQRESRRQSYGAAPSFGGIPLGATNTIQRQEFSSVGVDSRLQRNWGADSKHVATVGITGSYTDSPFRQWKGTSIEARTGAKEKDLDRSLGVVSVFTENRFNLGKFSITPGIRMENIFQDIKENFNSNLVTAPESGSLRGENRYDQVALFGLGSTYEISEGAELYANISQGYKPVTYGDAVPLQTGDTISGDLDPAKTITYEAGVRGEPTNWLTVDSSVFYTTFKDQFGRLGSQIANVGDGRYQGIEGATELSITQLANSFCESNELSSLGNFSLYANASLLDAEFNAGPADGKIPQFAPDYLVRTGLVYSYDDRAKLAFLGNFIDSVYADDANTSNRRISAYSLWDLTAEYRFTSAVKVVGGVNNIFNEEYISRIRGNGLEPGNPRNIYAGLSVSF